MSKAEYDCLKCIGTCCSVYDHVPVTRRDVLRLARHFLLSEEEATRRFTKMSTTSGRILRRKRDPLLGRTCMFHDLQKRVCGIYEARPQVCREWPAHGDGCVYYDLLQFERKQQGDETIVPLIQIRPLKDVLRNNRRMKG